MSQTLCLVVEGSWWRRENQRKEGREKQGETEIKGCSHEGCWETTSSAWMTMLTSNQASAVLSWLCVTGSVYVCMHACMSVYMHIFMSYVWKVCVFYLCVCLWDVSGTNSSFPAETSESDGLRLTFIMSPCKEADAASYGETAEWQGQEAQCNRSDLFLMSIM